MSMEVSPAVAPCVDIDVNPKKQVTKENLQCGSKEVKLKTGKTKRYFLRCNPKWQKSEGKQRRGVRDFKLVTSRWGWGEGQEACGASVAVDPGCAQPR